VTIAVSNVAIAQVHQTPLALIVLLTSTSCPIRLVAIVLLIAPLPTMSRLAPTVYPVIKPVSLAMESPVPTVTVVLMACFSIMAIVGMCVHKKLSPTKIPQSVTLVIPNVSFASEILSITAQVVKLP
jgi:hypothetical protein